MVQLERVTSLEMTVFVIKRLLVSTMVMTLATRETGETWQLQLVLQTLLRGQV